jgi:hypothetical protein
LNASQTITIPNHLNLTKAVQFARELAELPESKLFIPDFSELGWIEPFSMLILAQAFCDLKDRYPQAVVIMRTPDSEACSYADWMGFFKASRLRDTCPAAPGSEAYIPVTFEKVSNIEGRVIPQERIPEIAKTLAERLLQQDSGNLFTAVVFSFQEIIRNVIEHSESESFGYCAQRWLKGPNEGVVELAFMDSGVGLRTSLQKNTRLEVPDDREAIKSALMPGISGAKANSAGSNARWANSGFGLYMTSRLCSEKGDFFICSGSTGLHYRVGVENEYFDTSYSGTLIRMRINVGELGNADALLRKYSDEGEAIAYSIKNKGARITGSTMSKFLNTDYANLRDEIVVGDRVVHQKAKFGEGVVLELIRLTTNEPGAMVQFDNGRKQRVALSALTRVLEL